MDLKTDQCLHLQRGLYLTILSPLWVAKRVLYQPMSIYFMAPATFYGQESDFLIPATYSVTGYLVLL